MTDTPTPAWGYRPGNTPSHYYVTWNTTDVAEFLWLRPVAHEAVAMQRLIDALNRPLPDTRTTHHDDWTITTRSIRDAVWEFMPQREPTVLAVMWLRPVASIRTAATIIEQLLTGLNPGGGLDAVTIAKVAA